MRYIGLTSLFLMFLFYSCNQKNDRTHRLITERIQYDVDIKSPDPDFDWWVQNIEGSKREQFVKGIIERAYSGEVDIYDYYFNNKLSAEEVRMIGYKCDTLTFQRSDPPYDLYDTIVEKKLDLRDITRIRFLEEWTLDEKTMEIHKRVIGLAPLARNYNESGEFRGFMPLFWFYFDESYQGIKE